MSFYFNFLLLILIMEAPVAPQLFRGPARPKVTELVRHHYCVMSRFTADTCLRSLPIQRSTSLSSDVRSTTRLRESPYAGFLSVRRILFVTDVSYGPHSYYVLRRATIPSFILSRSTCGCNARFLQYSASVRYCLFITWEQLICDSCHYLCNSTQKLHFWADTGACHAFVRVIDSFTPPSSA